MQEMSNMQLQSMAPEKKNVNSLGEVRETKQRYKHDRQNHRNIRAPNQALSKPAANAE